MPDATTKERLLDAGWALLAEHEGDLAYLKMQSVTRKAGLSSGAFYSNWASLREFHADLLRHAYGDEREQHSIDLRQSIDDALIGPNGPEEKDLGVFVRRIADTDFDALRRGPTFKLWMALWAAHASVPEAAEVIKKGYADTDRRWSQTFERILKAYGREVRPPFTPESLSIVFTALLEGLLLRDGVDRDATMIANGADTVTLFGEVLVALLPVLSDEVGAGATDS
ncbi:MAG: TetR/AcrR family transcriptional regulator [Actinomycetes bacterium]